MNKYFDEYLNDANRFINELSKDLGHPEEQIQTIRILRAVLHTIRDRISIPESLDFMSQLPMMLKAFYVEQWTFHEQPPLHYEDIEGFAAAVKNQQARLGETNSDWKEPTVELVQKTLNALRKYVSEGQAIHVMGQMPEGVRELF